MRQAVAIDQLSVGNLACLEQVTQRLVQLEMAVARNLRHPDHTGLSVIADGPVSADGSARAPKFLGWVTERQKEHAQILKQQRLFGEEQAAHERGAARGSNEYGGKGRGGKGKNAKAAPAKEGG